MHSRYTEIITSSLLVYSRTLFKEFYKIQSSSFDCIRNSNTCTITRSHLRVFKLKKRRFLSLDTNISLKQHKDTYGFHKRRSCWTKPGQHRSGEHNTAYDFHLVSPKLSLKKHSEETINSLEAIHFTPKCMSTFLIGSEVVRWTHQSHRCQ